MTYDQFRQGMDDEEIPCPHEGCTEMAAMQFPLPAPPVVKGGTPKHHTSGAR